MKSINTLYNGNYFRSRLEARWAYFFDLIGMKYEYEQEGFEHKGQRYLPDFFLPECYLRDGVKDYNLKTNKITYFPLGVYIEIKPESFQAGDIPASKWFKKPLILFNGMPSEFIWGGWNWSNGEGGYQLYPPWDNCMGIWKCQHCHKFKIEFAEGGYDNCPHCEKGQNDFEFLKANAEKTILKRFEYNE